MDNFFIKNIQATFQIETYLNKQNKQEKQKEQ